MVMGLLTDGPMDRLGGRSEYEGYGLQCPAFHLLRAVCADCAVFGYDWEDLVSARHVQLHDIGG